MILRIENYKNINKLNLNLEDSKINFIFGISGSGKTSISESVCESIDEEKIMIGKKVNEVKISIDDKEVDYNKVNVYNEDSINSLIFESNMNNDIYEVIFSDDKAIIQKKEEFEKSIANILKYKDELWSYVGKIDTLIKNFGGKLTKNTKLPRSSKIIKFEKAIEKEENRNYIEKIKNNGNNYLRWISEGKNMKLYAEKNICPFCENPVSNKRNQVIDELCNLTPKDFEILFDTTNILEELNIAPTDISNTEEIEILKKEIIKKIQLKEEILKIVNIIDYYNIDDFSPSNISIINISKAFTQIFPKIAESIDIINENIIQIKKILGELKRTTDKTICDNLKTLNNYIEKFGIPYKFKLNKFNVNERKANYILYHILDTNQNHRIKGLSYGEKNIISLLLFLISNNKEFVIIDDPASSYDDYRRKIIFDLIYYLQKGKTFIVLSHDVVFIKYAVFNKKQGDKLKDKPRIHKKFKLFSENTGKILAFENYNNIIKTKDISFDDFGTIEKQIRNHLNNSLSYFRKIINLRILAECKKSNDNEYEIIYNYLSAILHKKSKNTVLKELKSKGCEEDYIINLIKNKFKTKIENMPDDILYDFKIEDLTDFEKIFYYRDDIQDEVIRDEFNNIIHMNSSYTISLNPYKFNYFSPYVYNNIKKAEV